MLCNGCFCTACTALQRLIGSVLWDIAYYYTTNIVILQVFFIVEVAESERVGREDIRSPKKFEGKI